MNLKNKNFNLSNLSIYRGELMGMATIMILLCHASPAGVIMPGGLAKILSFGNMGVEVFFLMSGMGMGYSLMSSVKNRSGHNELLNWIVWETKKLLRVIVPYLAIAIPWYGYIALNRHESFYDFLLNVSTISYWTHHKGAWFVAALLPLYLLTPCLFRLFRSKFGAISAILLVFCCISIEHWGGVFIIDNPVFQNISFAIKRIPCFLIGVYLAPKINEGISIPYWTVFFFAVMLIAVVKLMKSDLGYYIPYCTLACIVCCGIASIAPYLSRILKLIGEVSLESYILNLALINIIPSASNFDDYGIMRYSLIVIIGILSAFAINRYFSKPILSSLNKNLF